MNTHTIAQTMQNPYTISPYARFLQKNGMRSMAVLYQHLNQTMMRRACRTVRFLLEEMETPTYESGQVVFLNYHYNIRNMTVDENKALYCNLNGDLFLDESAYQAIPTENAHEEELKRIILDNTKNARSMKCMMRYVNYGNHTSMNFPYVLAHGFNGYRAKITETLRNTDDLEVIDFQTGMLDLLSGMETYINRYRAYLKTIENPDEHLQNLISALEVVPFAPPKTFYQAYLMMEIVMFFGDSFEPCRIDQLLLPYYESDDTIDREKALFYIRSLFVELERRMPHPGSTHVTIGGSKADGTPAYNELTELCVLAIRGLRAPNVTLCMREDMPQPLWDAFLYNISKGYTQPAMVNDSLYVEGFVNEYHIPREDAVNYVFGGCSEIFIQGKTNNDAVWAGYNMLDILEDTLYSNLLTCDSYEAFYQQYKHHVKLTLKEMVQQNNMRLSDYALHYTYPFRTLFVDGCLDKSRGFTDGGATYNFSSAAFFGASNTFNALYAVKECYANGWQAVSKETLLQAMTCNYQGYEGLRQRMCNLPKFGNYNEDLNRIAHDLMSYAFDEIKQYRGTRGEAFYLPTMIFWITWLKMGKNVGATPDGRLATEPLADSVGATQGTDKEGPTAALGAALAIPQKECVGTAVFNLYLDGSNFADTEKTHNVQSLIEAYLLGGGCQVQVNVVDKERLKDALVHPEQHQDIIVRVGGFSDNFVYLTDEIKQQVIARNEL